MSAIVNALMRGVRSEVQNVKSFVMTPIGPFETVDAIIKDARRTVREVAGAVGVRQVFGQRRVMERKVLRR